MMLYTILVVSFAICANADVSHIVSSTHAPIAYGQVNPYVFSYQAGRAPGHVDHTHTEVSDGSGVIRGKYSYVDPQNQVRTVQYVADKYGFHPQLSHAVEDSPEVKLAKQRHLDLYNRIAQEHASQAATGQAYNALIPRGSPAVIQATHKHLSLYDRIAAEHAAIGAQQEAVRAAFEATSEHTPLPHV